MAEKLARVRWHRGQTLLPEHLFAQEESLLTDTIKRFQLCGMPLYGIGSLEWNDSLLSEGIVSIVRMALVLPSGFLVDIPGNATISPFNMDVIGTTQVAVYLHLLENLNLDNIYSDDAPASIASEDAIPRVIYELHLSSEPECTSAIQTLKLAEFQKDGGGTWSLMDDYVPPLLQVGTSPFVMQTVNYLAQLLELFHFKLIREITASYLSGESLFISKQCLQGVYELQSFFANLRAQIHYHPYQLYEILKSFYINVCLYKNCTPENVDSPYLHDQLALCLKKICDPLFKQLQLIKSKSPYIPFKKEDGLFVISRLPKEINNAKEAYLLLQKPHVHASISIEGLKLASRRRVSMVHQQSLTGIPLKKIDNPPFQHSFGAEVEFFLIVQGEEWDHAFGDSTLAFYDVERLEGITAYLYWRQ